MNYHSTEIVTGRLELLQSYAYAGWAGACITTVLLLLLLSHFSGRVRPARTVDLHNCQRASASLEFLLVFFPLLAIVLAVWQLAFMLNAQLSVGYAAYAAGRSASTVAYMELPDEPVGTLIGDGSKWTRINRAAIPGVLAISPSNAEKAILAYASAKSEEAISAGALPSLPDIDIGAVPGRLTLMTLHREDAILKGNRAERLAVKSTYATASTNVLINGQDKSVASLNLGTAETIDVTVKYDFWLNVPFAGRMMKAAFGGPVFSAIPLPDVYQPTLRLSETVTVRAWPKLTAY